MGDPVQWSNGGLTLSWKQMMLFAPAALAIFGLGALISPARLAVIDEDTLKAITLAVKENGRQDETFVGGGGVTRAEFQGLTKIVEGNAEGIAKLVEVNTENSQLMVRLLERSISPRGP